MPMALRPMRSATMAVVPAPEKGSRTVHGAISATWPQDGSQPEVDRSRAGSFQCEPLKSRFCFEAPYAAERFEWPASLAASCVVLPLTITSRFHGAPHSEQQPRSEVPAAMQRRANSGGKVAKCASGNDEVGMV